MKKGAVHKRASVVVVMLVMFLVGIVQSGKDFFREQMGVMATEGPEGVIVNFRRRALDEDANVNLVMGFIITAIVLAMGVIILYNVQTASPAIPNSSAYYTLQVNLNTTTVSSFGLMAIILIVMAAAGILAVLMLFGPQRRK